MPHRLSGRFGEKYQFAPCRDLNPVPSSPYSKYVISAVPRQKRHTNTLCGQKAASVVKRDGKRNNHNDLGGGVYRAAPVGSYYVLPILLHRNYFFFILAHPVYKM